MRHVEGGAGSKTITPTHGCIENGGLEHIVGEAHPRRRLAFNLLALAFPFDS